jgi:peptidoglycan hydrolase FlgJ
MATHLTQASAYQAGMMAGARAKAVASDPALPKDAKAWKTAQDFEQMFMEQTLGQLTSGLTGEGPLGDEGSGADIWRGMLTQQYAGTITKAGGVGVADSVYRELMRIQETSDAG